ncbi:hypothetical protein MHU86_24746 [Fragilaria crotonensis]|nr:hypothetical protein MHU86_24746 [Fragilaria crotonensis]
MRVLRFGIIDMNQKVLRLRLYLIVLFVVGAPDRVTSFASNAKASCVLSARHPTRSSFTSPSSCQSSSTSSNNDSNSSYNDSEQFEPTDGQQGQEYRVQQLEEDLSDLDARVLRSMLSDGSLDLLTEDDMRQLLDRASGPKDASLPPIPSSDSDYESKTLQALMDTKLWKALSAKKDDLLESAKIFIENRIERDTRLLASLGIFVWDRVVRDVARALPAASSSGAVGRAVRTATRQLQGSATTSRTSASTTGSDVDDTVRVTDARKLEDLDLYEEMNTPLDEIKSVTQAIQDILKGEASSTASQRGIRTAAPAGQKTRTERQQRAYQKRKQTVLKREKEGVDVLRVAGKVVDAAYEVRRDLQVEVNKPGYKTERVRTAIAAGAETTSRVIAAARDGSRGSWKNILFGTKEKEQVLELESAEATLPEIQELPELPTIPDEPTLVVPVVPLPAELLDEQNSVVSRLKLCIEKPENTWLTQEILASSNAVLNTDSLRDVVTAMIIARDDLDVKASESNSMKELIGSLRKVKSTIDTVISIAETSSTLEVASNLRNILYGYDPADEIQPTLLSIDEIQTIYQREIREAEAAAEAAYEEAVAARERVIIEWEQAFDERERLIQEAKEFAARLAAAAEEAALNRERERAEAADAAENVVLADVAAIDAAFEKSTSTVARFSTSDVEVIVDDDFQSAVAEIIFDDSAFDDQDDVLRSISDATNDEAEERNLLADATLRSLDIVFAVVEKVILLLPGVVKMTTIASSRLDEASRGGLGRIGWSRLVHTQTGSKRY